MSAILPNDDRGLPAAPPEHPTLVPRRGYRSHTISPRSVAVVLGITLGTLLLLALGYLAWHAISWIFVAAFVAMALNPAVELLIRRGLRRGVAVAAVFVLAIVVFGAIAFLLVPPLVGEVIDFVEALPSILRDGEQGRGPLGWFERQFGLVERLENALADGGASAVLGFTTPAVQVAKAIATTVFSLVAVAFLTFFMLLDGKRWVAGFLDFVPDGSRPRWERSFGGIYRTVGGYVTGNLLICALAGVVAGTIMSILGVPYAAPLALLAALLNLVPMIGAPFAGALIVIVTFASEGVVAGVVVLVVYVVYQQVENHAIQPLVYGRAVKLSPLAVLISVLIGAELGGVLGAIAAIPVGGSISVIAGELLRWRREAMIETPPGVDLVQDGRQSDTRGD
jgi:predicted PurR-regulated permease PerM